MTANDAFLLYCENYHTADRQRYLEAYEREDQREKAVAQGTLGLLEAAPDNDLRSETQGVLWNLRTSTGTQQETPRD